MINLFDLGAGASARVAATTARDGSSPARGTQSDRKEYADFKTAVTGGSMRRTSSDRSGGGGTPMKTLIAREMAKEGDANQRTTNVIARLMGLDDGAVALPRPAQPSSRRRSSEGHLSMARVNSQMSLHKRASSVESVEYKDVYEVGYQPQRSEHLSNGSSRRGGRPREDHDQRRMDLVRQKFVEAKQLASHENLLQSKEFHDALETLNSNRDLFLKFLEEPNSLFVKQSGEFHSAPTSPQRKRITVLKPTKSVEVKSENAIQSQQSHAVNESRTEKRNLHRKPNADHAKAERFPGHTRIVVLKPTAAIISVEQFQQIGHGNSDDSDAPVASRHSSDEIHWSAHGMRHQHDECLQGSTQSNMVGRDSSCCDRAEEAASSFSGSETGSPTSRHSWDYVYRFSNPYFGSSLSHASCSPEAHVARDGKKHTSDRWPSASYNEINREKVLTRRSLSTLGEMLAMADMKKEEPVVDQVPTNASNLLCGNEPRLAVPSTSSIDSAEGETSIKKISRSKSVPVSSSAFGSLRLDARSSDPPLREPTTPKEEASKPRNGKSSLKGRISSFFSIRKRAGKEKPTSSISLGLNGRVPPDTNWAAGVSPQDDVASENSEDKFQYATIVLPVTEPDAPSSKAVISLEKALSFEIRNSHFDQPSPTSVLDVPFEDSNEKSASSSESAITAKQEPLSRCLPIGSVARTLSWDDSSEEAAAAPCSSKEEDSHEQEQHEFVEKILSSAGLGNDIFARWHSLDSPLGPSVPDQFLERKVEDAKCRERRSNQRLLIDSVNAALLHIGQSRLWAAYPCAAGPIVNAQRVASGNDETVADAAWKVVKGWLSDEEEEEEAACMDDNVGVAADRVVDREIQGGGWGETLRLEVDEISREICGDVLGEAVEEALSELAGCH